MSALLRISGAGVPGIDRPRLVGFMVRSEMILAMAQPTDRCRVFRQLHESGTFVGSDFTTVADLTQAGVRRISVGGALARAAWTGFLEAAREIAEHGTFIGLSRALPFAVINQSFGRE